MELRYIDKATFTQWQPKPYLMLELLIRGLATRQEVDYALREYYKDLYTPVPWHTHLWRRLTGRLRRSA